MRECKLSNPLIRLRPSVHSTRKALSVLLAGIVFPFLLALSCLTPLHAQSRTNLENHHSDPRGEPELVLCSQNLNNFGDEKSYLRRVKGATMSSYKYKLRDLIARFYRAQCDIIAVQEVLGRTEEKGLESLAILAKALKEVSNREFDYLTGETNDKLLRQGFLVAKDRATVLNKISYARVDLPQLSKEQKPHFFSRGPLEVQFSIRPRTKHGKKRLVTVVNIHFKSQSSRSGTDPSGLAFETLRMEMAEAVRRVVYDRHRVEFERGSNILAIVGDRNSNFDVASAKILEGTLHLSDFQGSGPCRLSMRGVPLCQVGAKKPGLLFSLLLGDPQAKLSPGTLRFRDSYSWVDDILVSAHTLPLAWERPYAEGDYSVGVLNDYEEASDHALVWAKFNW